MVRERSADHPRPRTGARGAAAGGRAAGARQAAAEARAERPGGWGGLFRGAASTALGGLGVDGPARSLERLAASAERTAALLDALDAEVGVERVSAVLDRLGAVPDILEDILATLERIERAATGERRTAQRRGGGAAGRPRSAVKTSAGKAGPRR